LSYSVPVDERRPTVAEGDTTKAPELGLYKARNRMGTEYTTKMSAAQAEALGYERVGDARTAERKPGPDDPEGAYAAAVSMGGRMHPEEQANVEAVEEERDEALNREALNEKRRATANKARQATANKARE
jgi:hypothetical protein